MVLELGGAGGDENPVNGGLVSLRLEAVERPQDQPRRRAAAVELPVG